MKSSLFQDRAGLLVTLAGTWTEQAPTVVPCGGPGEGVGKATRVEGDYKEGAWMATDRLAT